MLTDEKVRIFTKRLLMSRMRILLQHGFYGLLLMHMKFVLSEELDTAATDGENIIFGTSFMDELSDSELDFVMMHEILHVVLRHCTRDGYRNHCLFNIACDIVVNSNILYSNNMDLSAITLKVCGESMHLTPDKKEGCHYTAEEVYEMLLRSGKNQISGGYVDNHSRWGMGSPGKLKEEWDARVIAAGKAMERKRAATGTGNIPLCAERLLKELTESHIDWRTILNDFVQEEINDYSFSPPDRRFDDSPFFLPDYNEKTEYARNILFMIDASGSVSEQLLTEAYSEIRGAVEQFDGRLHGLLGFFDAEITPPEPFEDLEDLKGITPKGGGGTSFFKVFDFIRNEMSEIDLQCIVILTDGYAPFPPERAAGGIPVLWMISNDKVTPPWGKTCWINRENSSQDHR